MNGNLQTVTAADALLITVFSMVVVFIVLTIISYIINLLKIFSKEKTPSQPVVKEIEAIQSSNETLKEPRPEDEYELIAVIAAAIAAMTGKQMSEIQIKSIKRTHTMGNSWQEIAKQENLMN